MASFLYITTIVVATISAFLYAPIQRRIAIFGINRPLSSWQNVHGIENRVIENTIGCEDVHYHEPTGLLFTACHGDIAKAAGWFPPGGAAKHPEDPSYGTLVVIDSKTFESKKLSLSSFEGPFVPHGISIYTSPSDPDTIYIFAVNHPPNPLWSAASPEQPPAASRIEVFKYVVGSDTATRLNTISHPLIRTPNDILALSETEFLVTNDHHHYGGFMRIVEDLVHKPWTTLVYVRIGEDAASTTVEISSAEIVGNNGLGWGPNGQVLVSEAMAGRIVFTELGSEHDRNLTISHAIPADGVVDNPSFFSDPYTSVDGKDYSGYLLPGIGRMLDFARHSSDPTGQTLIPSIVYYLPASAGKKEGRDTKPTLLFSDDGRALRGVTAALIVPIDPATNDGRREGWLVSTGVIGPHMLATRIDFATALV
ncbi:hypothetical protein M426DRAFT_321522 [Hypoxylon sp. CI-4A]|nr:hypothetical protein M426DRAFT_321522 [Hypoxylon sp. CI-4A]